DFFSALLQKDALFLYASFTKCLFPFNTDNIPTAIKAKICVITIINNREIIFPFKFPPPNIIV
ncbi:hypothetical protein, partial [Bacillus pseudomycoides]|uniref:hypothetical protein n=2 Tax=Bacillus pseudomycoides TaxID=64104 RepID=UPI001C3EA72C